MKKRNFLFNRNNAELALALLVSLAAIFSLSENMVSSLLYFVLSFLGIELGLLFLKYDRKERRIEAVMGKRGVLYFDRTKFFSFYWGKTEKVKLFLIDAPVLFLLSLFSRKFSRPF